VTPEGPIVPLIDPVFAGSYSYSDLGLVPGVPTLLGGLTFKSGDPNTLLIGGDANDFDAKIYQIGVLRNAQNHITGFSGSATFFADAHGISAEDGGVDGGLAYGPGGVLFFTSYPDNRLGQIIQGNTTVTKLIDLTDFNIGPGADDSVGTLAFVPPGFAGAGSLKIANYDGSAWYSVDISPDGNGTYDIISVSSPITLAAGGSGPAGIIYVDSGNPVFTTDTVLIFDYTRDAIYAYGIDNNGDPLPASEQLFMSGLDGALGAIVDPLTGDFLFSTFGGGDHVIAVQGFTVIAIPEPSAGILAISGLAVVAFWRRRNDRRTLSRTH